MAIRRHVLSIRIKHLRRANAVIVLIRFGSITCQLDTATYRLESAISVEVHWNRTKPHPLVPHSKQIG